MRTVLLVLGLSLLAPATSLAQQLDVTITLSSPVSPIGEAVPVPAPGPLPPTYGASVAPGYGPATFGASSAPGSRPPFSRYELREAARAERAALRASMPRQRQRWEVVAPGIVSLLGGYVGWVVTAITWSAVNTECSSGYFFPSCSHNGLGANGSDALLAFLPLVGPWWSIAESSSMRGWDLVVAGLAGVAQAAGLITLIAGLAMPVSDDVILSTNGTGLDLRVRFQ